MKYVKPEVEVKEIDIVDIITDSDDNEIDAGSLD